MGGDTEIDDSGPVKNMNGKDTDTDTGGAPCLESVETVTEVMGDKIEDADILLDEVDETSTNTNNTYEDNQTDNSKNGNNFENDKSSANSDCVKTDTEIRNEGENVNDNNSM